MQEAYQPPATNVESTRIQRVNAQRLKPAFSCLGLRKAGGSHDRFCACDMATQAGLMRTIGRCGLRRATSLKPALSYMDFAPNHMYSSLERPGLSTGYASSSVAPCFLA